MNLPTVLEIWRLALPPGTTMRNTQGDLDRPVSWVHRMASHPPVFAGLETGELALVPTDQLRFIDDRLSVAGLVTSLGERGIAAVAVDGEVDTTAVRAADDQGICLLGLLPQTDLRVTEKDVLRLILDREAQLDRRGRQLYRLMAQESIGNQGLPAIAESLSRAVQRSVVVLSRDFAVVAAARDGVAERSFASLEWVAEADPVRAWLTSGELDSKSPPYAVVSDERASHAVCVSAIVGDGQVDGFVVVFGDLAYPDALDRLAAERAALACAVEMAKRQAVSEAEERLRGDFLNMLLTSGTSEAQPVARRASEMGYPLEGQNAVLVLDLDDSPARAHDVTAQEVHAQLVASKIPMLVCKHESGLAVLCKAVSQTALETIEARARAIFAHTTAIVPGANLAIGIGGRGQGLTGLRQSYHQAQETLSLVRELFEGGGVLAYGELPLYHLLRRLQDSQELEAFQQKTLASLADYDRDHDSELVTTLKAYFSHFGNVSQTANSLHLHRNSLIYRLERIRDITGLNLDHEEDRFALQLALRLQSFAKA